MGGAPAKLGAEYTKKENGNGRFGSCVDGSVLARTFFTFAALVVQVQPCVRLVSAAHETAGYNALRGSGPNQKLAFDNASLNAADVPEGSLSIDRGCRRRVRFSFVFP